MPEKNGSLPEIKRLLAGEAYDKAIDAMIAAVHSERDPDRLLALSKCLDKIPDDEYAGHDFIQKKVAVMGGYTTQLLTPLIRLALFARGISAQLFETEYGLLEQAVLSNDDAIREFGPDVCYFCVGTHHIRESEVTLEVQRWSGLWKQTRECFGCEIIQNTFEEPLDRTFLHFDVKRKDSRTNFVKRLNLELANIASEHVHFCDIDYLASYHGRKFWDDERYYDVAKVPVSHQHLWDYASACSSVVAAIFGKRKKCLVLDLDNTVWGGIVGDDGAEHLQVGNGTAAGEAYWRFQQRIKALKDSGVILAVCSKNDESVARDAFKRRADMALRLEDFSCFIANWEPKPQNIQQIANRLNIGLESIVFVDDNPVERDLVRQSLRTVTVLEMPDDPSLYASVLSWADYFETTQLTEEDRKRTDYYRADLQRSDLQQVSGTYDDFLKQLEMRAHIAPFDELHLDRVVQLINKTNQFNLTTKRYTEGDVRRWLDDPAAVTRYVRLRDKFGDNGLISVLLAREEKPNEFWIDTWLMSCRVLKRGVEEALLARVVEELLKRRGKTLFGTYCPTPKNMLVKDLLRSLGFSFVSEGEEGSVIWKLDLTDKDRIDTIVSRGQQIVCVTAQDYDNDPGPRFGQAA